MPIEDTALTVKDVAARFRVNPDKVLAWIRSGQLRALNLTSDPASPRPRWRILPDDLVTFEQARSSTTPPVRRGRPRKSDHVVKEFV